MKKCIFYKMMQDYKPELQKGWETDVINDSGNKITICLHKERKYGNWHCTEKTTGYAVPVYGVNRQEVIEQIEPLIEKIIQKISQMNKAKKIIYNAYNNNTENAI